MGTNAITIKARNDSNLTKIELNDMGDCAVISTDDETFFEQFDSGYNSIVRQAEELEAKFTEIDKKYEGKEDFWSRSEYATEKIRAKKKLSEEIARITDSIFGEGTTKKLFRNIYEEIPDFVPSADCFITFFEQVAPEIGEIFGKTIEGRNKASKERMAKYIPGDHKKPQKKGGPK